MKNRPSAHLSLPLLVAVLLALLCGVSAPRRRIRWTR